MSRDVLFVMDPLEGIDPNHDTTYVIMRETESRDRTPWVCQSGDLFHHDNELRGDVRPVSVDVSGAHYEWTGKRRVRELDQFDLVWMREDPPFDRRYLHATYLLDRSSPPVVNDPSGIRNTNEKLSILDFPELIPETWVGANLDRATEVVQSMGRAVVKSLQGYGGEEVHLLDASSDFEERLREVTDGGKTAVMIQEYLPSVTERGDRRIIVLGGEPIGGLTRMPADGDFRANLHVGGRADDAYVTETERDLCRQIRPYLVERGLHLVGLDLIDNLITEINVTSPTCVQEINRLSDRSLETEIVDYVEETLLE